jgi:hypothetical protein
MLTMVGLIRRLDNDFDQNTYHRIRWISLASSVNLCAALLLLLLTTMPVGQFDGLPGNWYSRLFDMIFAMTVLLAALSVGIVVMLYETVNGVIARITPGDEV